MHQYTVQAVWADSVDEQTDVTISLTVERHPGYEQVFVATRTLTGVIPTCLFDGRLHAGVAAWLEQFDMQLPLFHD